MKSWQIFAVGTAAAIAAYLLPAYESFLAGLAAIILVASVVAGFILRPRRDVFYLRTTLVLREPDHLVSVEHDRVAIRVELARLWLLFLPTFGGLAFLIVTSAKNVLWQFSILNFLGEPSNPVLLGIRFFLVLVIGIIATWLSERWVLRDAAACSADTVTNLSGRLLYSFKDRGGGYYGGDCFPFALQRSAKLARIVFYNVSRPELNKIVMGCLFHRVVIIGRGLTDLDAQTVAARMQPPEPASQGA
jgi:hypothetical protein